MPDVEASKILNLYRKAQLADEKERTIGERCFQFVNNRVDGELGQWDASTRSELKAAGKPLISFNEIKKFVNRVAGAMAAAKADEKCFPRDDQSDPAVAEILTGLIKYVYDLGKQAWLAFRRSFRDMLIWRGYIKVEWSDEFDPLGEISIKSVNPKNVYLVGAGDRYDLLDRKGIIEVLPLDKEYIIERWPKSEGEFEGLSSDAMQDRETPVASGNDYDFTGTALQSKEIYDKDLGKYIVLRYQRFVYEEAKFIKNPQTQELKVLEVELTKEQEAEIKPLLTTKKIRKVKVSYSIGTVLLEDELSTAKHGRWDIVPVFAYTDGGLITSVAQDLLDPQEEKNKLHSQVLHILGTAARNSYITSKGIFDDIGQTRRDFSKTGMIHEANVPIGQIRNAIIPIENNFTAVPAIIQMGISDTAEMKEISGLQDASLGQVPTGVKSGRGIEALQQPTEMIIAELFDNMLISRWIVGQLVLSLIQQYYTEERRVRILGDYSPSYVDPKLAQQVQMGLVSYEQGAMTATINKKTFEGKLNDVTVGRYDVVIDQVSQSPTLRRAMYYDLLNMKSMGAPIGWNRIIEASDIRNKTAILSEIQQQEQQMMMVAMMQAQAGKTATPPKNVPNQPDEGINLMGGQSPQ